MIGLKFPIQFDRKVPSEGGSYVDQSELSQFDLKTASTKESQPQKIVNFFEIGWMDRNS